jgi:hypothetical protein
MNKPTEYLILTENLELFFGGTYAQFEDCYGYADAGGDQELEVKIIMDFLEYIAEKDNIKYVLYIEKGKTA